MVEIQEFGAEMLYRSAETSWKPIALPGTRLGSHFELIEGHELVLEFKPSHTPTSQLVITLHCGPSNLARWPWLKKAQEFAENHDHSVAKAPLLDPRSVLDSDSLGIWDKAALTNLKANYFYRIGSYQAAEATYTEAAQLWLYEKQFLRAATMRLAAAEIAYRRLDKKAAAARFLKINFSFARAGTPYFQARLDELACKLQTFGAHANGFYQCRERIITAYREIGETADEINSMINLAYVMMNELKQVNSAAISARLTSLPKDSSSALYFGRFFLLDGLNARAQGQVSTSIKSFHSALYWFSHATEETLVSMVNVHVFLADIYAQLGLYEQAHEVVVNAFAIVKKINIPARTAVLINQLGEVLFREGRLEESREVLLTALTLSDKLSESELGNIMLDLLAVESELNLDINPILRREFPDTLRADLLHVRLLAQVNKGNDARHALNQALARARVNPIATEDSNEIELLWHLLDSDNSIRRPLRLPAYLYQLAQTADQSPTAALAYLTLRSGEKVRRAWIDSLTRSTEPTDIFRAALLATPARFMTSVVSPQKQVEIVAKQAAGEQGFLAQLTGPQEKPPARFKAALVPSLAQFQASLPEGAQALLLLPGDKQSAALWLSREGAKLVFLPARATILAASLRLNQALASPQSAPKAAEAAAAGLSGLLFADAPVGAAPKQLWILADELSAAIPFSALPWPGSSVPLVQSTDTSLMTGVRVDPTFKPLQAAPSKPTFFAPAYTATGAAALQSLEFAGLERARIERESAKTWAAMTGTNATRAAFQDLIQTPGAWLHVAAHGKADPGVLGNAGLWLANSKGPDADFLSWLELGNIRNQAELMVLNACQSATGAQPSRQANVSFALAMSTSGANHVVAALWPVSDVASGTWIPAFYRQLGQGGHAEHSASAVRQAQLSLYNSPHYRHPFYWGSLVHFRKVVF